MSWRKTLCEVQAAPANASPSTACITETDIVAEYFELFEGVGLLEGDVQISLQTTEAALDFRFDHFIVIILASGKSLQ